VCSTVEQLGYIVWSGEDARGGVPGFMVQVQSGRRDKPAALLAQRVERFMQKTARPLLRSLSEKEFRTFANALLHKKTQVDPLLIPCLFSGLTPFAVRTTPRWISRRPSFGAKSRRSGSVLMPHAAPLQSPLLTSAFPCAQYMFDRREKYAQLLRTSISKAGLLEFADRIFGFDDKGNGACPARFLRSSCLLTPLFGRCRRILGGALGLSDRRRRQQIL
jgi:secreted Zn-dependent insulinase-like peptidase